MRRYNDMPSFLSEIKSGAKAKLSELKLKKKEWNRKVGEWEQVADIYIKADKIFEQIDTDLDEMRNKDSLIRHASQVKALMDIIMKMGKGLEVVPDNFTQIEFKRY